MSEIKIEQAGLTDIGNVRKGNEDSFGFVESIHGPLFTVCDGMGGHVGGATASQIAVKCILEYISSSNLASPSVEINNAIVVANQEILDAANTNPELKGMGTTCTVLLVTKDSIHIGYVGDSRIYVLSDNRLYRITKDHSFVQTLVDAGVISDSEAESHPRKNELTRALGVRQVVEPTISQQPITPKKGDVFMLCSDGLCGLVNDSSMQEILTKNYELNAAARELINAAKNAGGHDNITVQLLRVNESPYQRSSFPDFSPKENLSNTMVQTPNMEMQIPARRSGIIFNKMQLIVASLILVIIVLGTILTVNNFSQGKEEFAKTESSSNGDDNSNNSSNQTNPVPAEPQDHNGGLLSCDKFNGVDLEHKVSVTEKTYDRIKNDHKKNYLDQYDFSIPYNDKNKKLDPDKINAGQIIKWKKKTQPEVVTQSKNTQTPAANTTTTPKDVSTTPTPTPTPTVVPVVAPQQQTPCEIAKKTEKTEKEIAENTLKNAKDEANKNLNIALLDAGKKKNRDKVAAEKLAKDNNTITINKAEDDCTAAKNAANVKKKQVCNE